MAADLKLGLVLGYWFAQPPTGVAEQIATAEDLGFDSVWSAEAYGSDCFTPLAWYGSQTTRVQLGTAVCQMAARTPVATAMSALTLDHLTGGRFILGLGASGPQVVEGGFGPPYPRPRAFPYPRRGAPDGPLPRTRRPPRRPSGCGPRRRRRLGAESLR